MNTADFLRLLRANGITLFLDPNTGRLKYRGPQDAFTPFIRATLREYMPEIVFLFNERAAIMEHDGKTPRDKAEALAAADVLEGGAL